MNFVENNGKKVAAILCVASALPVVGTVFAMESQPGWHGDKYVKADHKVAKGWTKVGSKSYYFDEKGNVDKTVSKNASATVVSTDIANTAKTVVKESTTAAVDSEETRLNNEVSAQDVQKTKTVVSLDNANVDVVKTTDTDTLTDAPKADVLVSDDSVVANTVTKVEPQAPEATVTPTTDTTVNTDQSNVPNTNVPTQDTAVAPAPEQTQPEAPAQPEQTQPAPAPEQPQPEAPAQPDNSQTNTSSSFQQNVAQAALNQVGDHKWCTEVATDSLNAASGGQTYGVYWPDQYMNLGSVFTDRSQLVAGDLVYYQNDGRAGSPGVNVPDHIAVYVGNGTVVNGGWNYGPNVATSGIDVPTGNQYYIRVNG